MTRALGWVLVVGLSLGLPRTARAAEPVLRLGMIGLDTSHVIAFTSYLNNPKNNTGCRVVAAYPGGSPDFKASATRVEGYTRQMREKFGVEMVGSIEELCAKVDGILLESVDGRPHLDQAKRVIAAKKPLFVDKPVANDLAGVIELFRLARENHVPCWSSSSARYGPGIIDARTNEQIGTVIGCDVFGSSSWAEHHPDLYLYGIHAVEPLFTVMGTGCEQVRRVKTDKADLVIGVWKGGRVGTFRDLRDGKAPGVAIVYGTKGSAVGRSGGYNPLLEQIVKFFKTGKPPVTAEETIEIYAFMSAADESKARGGAAVSVADVIARAKAKH